MILLRERDWDDKQYDICGNTARYAIEIDDSIVIPLCEECYQKLKIDIKDIEGED